MLLNGIVKRIMLLDTAGNPIIIHFTFQPHDDTDFITMNFREELLEVEQVEIA